MLPEVVAWFFQQGSASQRATNFAVHASKPLIRSFVWVALTSLLAQRHLLTFCFPRLLYQHFLDLFTVILAVQ